MLNLKKLVAWLSGTGAVTGQAQSGGEERRRFQRLNLENCQMMIAAEGPFLVTNLSFGGFRVDLQDYKLVGGLMPGKIIEVTLQLQQINLKCQIEIKNLFNSLAGCAFHNFSPAQSRIISEFIKPAILGFSLREIDSAKLKNDDPELKMRWFQGEDGVQVFLWQTLEGDAVRQEFYFLDYYIGWQNNVTGLQTGKIRPEHRSGFGRVSPDAVIFYRIPPYRSLKLGKVILECSKMPHEAREVLLREIASEEKRLFHRFIVKNGAVVFLADLAADREFPILNISMQGMALLRHEDNNFELNHEISGTVFAGETSVKIVFKPAYTHENLLGGVIATIDEEEQQKLEQFLAPRLLAQYLEEVPAPTEMPVAAAPGSRTWLYTGLHNTHILSLINPDGQLALGRIAFMDRAITCRRGQLQQHSCPDGLIFPADWELDPSINAMELEQATARICYEMVLNATMAQEVRKNWLKILEPAIGSETGRFKQPKRQD
ncbi:MAG TPA: PilZ domain-containing protein [Candidatus Rifleibacterium sp.]|nr:PilZ domain-containing protein [Candidatus Rifleibacterium sp.]HPT44843.1 PilZ domain-containing protein [Candidatus Rifleibacterium sp.]